MTAKKNTKLGKYLKLIVEYGNLKFDIPLCKGKQTVDAICSMAEELTGYNVKFFVERETITKVVT